jgi:Protein-L-isoaspartate(D-aspartate) O-methyltransferase (PCMT)
VPLEVQPYAYLNRPLPIGFDKTISQPLMVAVMTDLLNVKPDDVALEIGTGLGISPQCSPSWRARCTRSKSSTNSVPLQRRRPKPSNISFKESSKAFDNLKAVKHSGGVCCMFVESTKLVFCRNIRPAGRNLPSSSWPCGLIQGIVWLGLSANIIVRILLCFMPFCCYIYTGRTFSKIERH